MGCWVTGVSLTCYATTSAPKNSFCFMACHGSHCHLHRSPKSTQLQEGGSIGSPVNVLKLHGRESIWDGWYCCDQFGKPVCSTAHRMTGVRLQKWESSKFKGISLSRAGSSYIGAWESGWEPLLRDLDLVLLTLASLRLVDVITGIIN